MAPVELDDSPIEPMTSAFTVLKQKLELDVSFCPRIVKGKAILNIQPQTAQLRDICLNCRQLRLTCIKVEGRNADFSYSDLHRRVNLHPGTTAAAYEPQLENLERYEAGQEDELVISIPDKVKIRETRADAADQGNAPAKGEVFFAPLNVEIEYVLDSFRDALHFAGVEDGDARYPHAYTRNSLLPGMASCLFPCVDDGTTRCLFEISIRYPRTLGDALTKASSKPAGAGEVQTNGTDKADSVMSDVDDEQTYLTEEEKALEMSVVCSGELTDDILDPADSSRKTASFVCDTPVLPQHIGIVIGPFEHVDLSEYRDTLDDDRLGTNAIKVHAFCLPGEEEEVRNSAMILARTLDNFTERYQSYAFEKSYKIAFVDDMEEDSTHTASFSICSSRLLFPETVWEPLEHTTRTLIHAVASQWIGVDVIAQSPNDYWIISGGSWFMTELYLRELFGRNDHRFRQKLMVDKVMQMDIRRPSLYKLGEHFRVDSGEREFMDLKATLVLSILHNRLVKQSGKNGVDRCLYRLMFNARNGKLINGAISTEGFLDICEKVGHQKLDTFFNQWVSGSGCPTFECSPSFNKKKQVIQLTIKQTQADPSLKEIDRPILAHDVMREAKERRRGFRPTSEWPSFVGPMTIRIHEADGTPYEHIVDINSSTVKVEIPYNTKYKRLKRNKLNKERSAAAQGLDATGDAQEDIVFYSLGDLFLDHEEATDWRIHEWSPDDEQRMEQEAYEWIRVDADFEWICRANINDMPSYMYVSQLQQDKDVVAQAESIQYLALKEGHPLISSFLVKTLMDNRYFHGIRTMAAEVMAASAKKKLDWIGFFHLKKAFRELFCIPGSPMTRSNDFSDRSLYLIQCAIPRAIAKIKGEDGKAPMEIKRFLLDVMRYNDNRGNDYSDDHYLATLMRCLAECLTSSKQGGSMDITLNLEDEAEEYDFTRKAIEELGRHQRLDEWIPTYQNIYTTTALDCAVKLSMNRVTPFKTSEFLQYTQIGNADNVRLKAWDCLVRLGMIRNDAVLRYMMHEIHSDPSPFFRAQLLRILDLAIGQVATGEVFVLEEPKELGMNSLVIEQEADVSDREAMLSRRKLTGAMDALKNDLSSNETLLQALTQALKSTNISLSNTAELLIICELVVKDPKKTYWIKLKYPRYWKAQHLGKARVRFSQTERIRTVATKPLYRKQSTVAAPEAPPPAPKAAAVPVPHGPEAPQQAPQAPPVPAAGSKLKLHVKQKPNGIAPAGSPDQSSKASGVLNGKQEPSPIPAVQPPAPKEASPAAVPKPAQPSTSSPLETARPPNQAPVVPASSAAPSRASTATSATVPPAPAASPASMASPIPAPANSLRIKLKKSGPSKSSAGPKPPDSPAATPAPPILPTAPTPTTASPSSAPKPAKQPKAAKTPKPKKGKTEPGNKKGESLVVKLPVPGAALRRVAETERVKKRKLDPASATSGERPAKRLSTEPSGTALLGGGGGRVKWSRNKPGEPPRFLLTLAVGREGLERERLERLERSGRI